MRVTQFDKGVESLLNKPKVTLMLHTNNPIIKHKAGLLNLAEELGNVSKACKVMGVSRDTFYRYQELVEEGGIDSLIDKSRRSPNLKNRVDEATEKAHHGELIIAQASCDKPNQASIISVLFFNEQRKIIAQGYRIQEEILNFIPGSPGEVIMKADCGL